MQYIFICINIFENNEYIDTVTKSFELFKIALFSFYHI